MFFENPNLPKLNEVELEELEKPLTKEECFETLKLSSKGKCPGSDGFTVEFYLRFWSVLGEEMVQSFNHALIHGHLNVTQRQGIITESYPRNGKIGFTWKTGDQYPFLISITK